MQLEEKGLQMTSILLCSVSCPSSPLRASSRTVCKPCSSKWIIRSADIYAHLVLIMQCVGGFGQMSRNMPMGYGFC